MTWNENLHPPNGFVFTDGDGLEHRAGSLRGLASNLTDYRARRGLPIGNPTAEINEQLCKLYPSRCLKKAVSEKAPETNTGHSLMTRIGIWLREIWGRVATRQQGYVTEDESKARAAICLDCPHHTPFLGDCASCQEALHQISFQLRAGKDKYTKVLKACDRWGTDLRLDATLAQAPRADAPDNCWKKA